MGVKDKLLGHRSISLAARSIHFGRRP